MSRKKLARSDNFTLGIDEANTLRQGVHLLLADGSIQRVQLTIDITDTDIVEVDQRELTHATSSQSFHRPRPNATHPNHTYVCLAKPRKSSHTVETAYTAKSKIEICHPGSLTLLLRFDKHPFLATGRYQLSVLLLD